MKKGKLSAEERARGRLLENWQHRPEYGDPIGCIASVTVQGSGKLDHLDRL